MISQICRSEGISGLRSGEVWVDQSDKGVGVLGWTFGHGLIIISPHLESSVSFFSIE